jgi:DNA-binding XRE family transcriptional regulator
MNGLEIKKARIQKGYSQEYLGKLIGSSKRNPHRQFPFS